MKTAWFFALALFFYILYFSCRTVTVKHKMFPQLYNADSAYVMYYNTPGNPRFFKLVKLKDSLFFRSVVDNANGIIVDSSAGCSTEGKIYFYEGKSAVHTVYFSRAEGCRSLYFFVGAEKYFTSMNNAVREWLDKLQPTATEPKVTQ